jgi:hypothetical protein
MPQKSFPEMTRHKAFHCIFQRRFGSSLADKRIGASPSGFVLKLREGVHTED